MKATQHGQDLTGKPKLGTNQQAAHKAANLVSKKMNQIPQDECQALESALKKAEVEIPETEMVWAEGIRKPTLGWASVDGIFMIHRRELLYSKRRSSPDKWALIAICPDLNDLLDLSGIILGTNNDSGQYLGELSPIENSLLCVCEQIFWKATISREQRIRTAIMNVLTERAKETT